ncbi:MAG: hypothetical protein ACFFAH_07275 [Promethearchaeota archaeon]
MGNGIGIASFVISLILCFLTFIVLPIMIWRAIAMSASIGSISNSAVAAVATFGIVLLVVALIGLILGIVGTATSDKKTFGILGLVFSAICLLFLLGAMAIGARMVWG